MANTKFEDIYNRCYEKIIAYDKQGYSVDLFKEKFNELLMRAIRDYDDVFVNDITDYNDEVWNAALTEAEQNILTLSIIVYWVEQYATDHDVLRNLMKTKGLVSPANFLEKMSKLLGTTMPKLSSQARSYKTKKRNAQ